MRVYIAGERAEERRLLAGEFGDEAVCPEEGRGTKGEELTERLRLLAQCDAICLTADWRSEARTRLEKETADYLRIPEVRYFPAGGREKA